MFRSEIEFLKRYFSTSKAEKNVFTLILVIVNLLLIYRIGLYYQEPEIPDIPLSVIQSLYAENPQNKEQSANFVFGIVPKENVDVNQATQEALISLGCPLFIARRIVSFRKYTTFYQKSDLLKIHDIDTAWLSGIEPYLIFAERSKKPDFHTFQYPKNDRELPVSIEINSADTSELKKLRGIGSKLSARIVLYRDKLGGFYSLDQLQEVYGLKPEVIQNALIYLKLDTSNLKRVLINTEGVDVLSRHPYIRFKLANQIVNNRAHHGIYMGLDDLQSRVNITDSILVKLSHYLDFSVP